MYATSEGQKEIVEMLSKFNNNSDNAVFALP